MEEEPREQEILLQPELINVTAGGAVESVNGQTGDVVLTTSDLENTSDYQTGSEVESAISTAVGAEQTAREQADSTISASVTTVANDLADEVTNRTNADTALQTSIGTLTQDIAAESTARANADTSLQGQIDALTASSDVKDIVGTHAELENYDTSTLGNNDIIKVLQDETEDGATTYYRWNASTNSFSLVGEEGPYYTKSQTDTLLNAKANISSLATVATTGSYSDLVNTPSIPTKTSDLTNDSDFVSDASYVHTDNNFTNTLKTKLDGIAAGAEVNVQANWTQTDTSADDYIKNKPTIPTVNNATLKIQKNSTDVATFTANSSTNVTANISVPTDTNDLTNGAGFQTASDVQTAIAGKQDTLVSGTSIKTINNTSLLGSGDITIPVITVDSALSSTSTNPVQNSVIYAAIGDVESILQTLNSGSGV